MNRSAPTADANFVARLRAWPPIAARIVIVVPCAVLVGWIFDIEFLKRVVPGLVAMNPVSALAFLVLGFGLAVIGSRGIARTCALVAGVVGMIVLLRYVFGWDARIDVLLFPASVANNFMAPTTAFNFVLASLALWLATGATPRAHGLGQGLALGVVMVALLALTGYAYGVEKLYRLATFIAMAVHTALTFLIFAAGLLCLRPDQGVMARLTSREAGGTMLRRLLVPTVAVPLILGWIILRLQRAGFFEEAFSFTVLIITAIAFLAAMLWRNARLLDAEDARRAGVEAELRQAHTGLESTVQRRTSELRQAIEGVRRGLEILGSSAAEILAASSALAASANETAASVAETTTTVEEARQTAQTATQSAERVAASAQKAEEISGAGTEATHAAAVGMDDIRGGMRSIGESMIQLSNQTRAIGEIIAAVDELAERSNLLAVNAAIEAASAGAQGKGFAVVGQEMKYLAAQSRAATQQVRTILNQIQKATGAAVMTTEQAAKAVEAGVAQSTRAGESIRGLEASVREAASVATEIATSSREQLVGMNHVALAMEQIKSASTENVGEARRLEDAARKLNALGQQMRDLAERHKA